MVQQESCMEFQVAAFKSCNPKYLSTKGYCLGKRLKIILLSILLSVPIMSGVPYALLLDEDFMNCLQGEVLQQDHIYCMELVFCSTFGKIPFLFNSPSVCHRNFTSCYSGLLLQSQTLNPLEWYCEVLLCFYFPLSLYLLPDVNMHVQENYCTKFVCSCSQVPK